MDRGSYQDAPNVEIARALVGRRIFAVEYVSRSKLFLIGTLARQHSVDFGLELRFGDGTISIAPALDGGGLDVWNAPMFVSWPHERWDVGGSKGWAPLIGRAPQEVTVGVGSDPGKPDHIAISFDGRRHLRILRGALGHGPLRWSLQPEARAVTIRWEPSQGAGPASHPE